jgi:hypothetical protein
VFLDLVPRVVPVDSTFWGCHAFHLGWIDVEQMCPRFELMSSKFVAQQKEIGSFLRLECRPTAEGCTGDVPVEQLLEKGKSRTLEQESLASIAFVALKCCLSWRTTSDGILQRDLSSPLWKLRFIDSESISGPSSPIGASVLIHGTIQAC